MVSADGNLAICFNGEIYNYPALRAALADAGVRLRTTSDTEVLLHLYERCGTEMARHLRGMFAFAIWDDVRRGLYLARDAYGIKPLYTVNDGWTFRFASQVKALLAGRGVSRDPEPAGLVGFHLFGSVPEPFTLYRDIRALPAGHHQWIDATGPREPAPFANLSAVLAEGVPSRPSSDTLGERVAGAVSESVRAHMLADVEVGIFLSGGIDSGALLGLLRDAGKSDIQAITLAFDELRNTTDDETPTAARVAECYGARHHVRRVDGREFRHDLPAILDAMDQPSIDGINTWFVAKAAREIGLKVALSGLGGDEMFGGYPSFADVPRWRRRFGPLAAVPGLGWAARALLRRFAPRVARERPKALGMLEYANSWAGAYLLRRGLFLPEELTAYVDADTLRKGLRRLKPLQHLARALQPDPGFDIGRVCLLESCHYLRNQLLRDADWAGMAHGIEIRVPFVDVTLLRSLAPVLRVLEPGAGKAMLAMAPAISLPHEVVERSKTGFVVPTGAWMQQRPSESTPAPGSATGLVSRRWSRIVIEACAA
jgi:asparagine synthase (glutamine-hydrolysing)